MSHLRHGMTLPVFECSKILSASLPPASSSLCSSFTVLLKSDFHIPDYDTLLFQVFQCQITSYRGKTRTLVEYSISSIICPQLLGNGKWISLGSRKLRASQLSHYLYDMGQVLNLSVVQSPHVQEVRTGWTLTHFQFFLSSILSTHYSWSQSLCFGQLHFCFLTQTILII